MTPSPFDGVARGNRRYSFLNSRRPVVRTVEFHGLPISIEFDKGDVKRGVGDYGEVWENKYDVEYGEIPGSRTLADGEGVDVYLGDDLEGAEMVYVVHQLKRDQRTYDEPKCMLGFSDEKSAVAAYKRHGPKNRLGPVDAMTVDEFLNGFLKAAPKI